MQDILVSVIVPIFNMENYVEHCIETLVSQTYRNIEILLIDDGSTDSSPQKCAEWAERDPRIVFLRKENEGLSVTRNYGVRHSSGEYIMFVDSDDWVDKDYVKKMIEAVSLEMSDVGICDYYRTNPSGSLQYISCNTMLERQYTKEKYLLLSNPSFCNKIIRKKFWWENSMQFPDTVSEDTAIFPLLILLSSRISEVKEALYYYRKYRENSITSTIGNRMLFAEAYKSTVDYFQNHCMFEMYKKLLYRYFLEWSSNSLSPCLGKIDADYYKRIRTTYINFFKNNFADFPLKRIVVFGGYNLTKIAKLTSLFADPYMRFQFSSIISLKSEAVCKVRSMPRHNNVYRNFMLDREYRNTFFSLLDEERPEYILIDFIEERHDMVLDGGQYYTYSDALQESGFYKKPKLLRRTEPLCKEIWENACERFILELKKRFLPENVCLIKSYLAKEYGECQSKKVYESIQDIKRINNILKQYYIYFEEHFKGIRVIECFNDSTYFTDHKYEYGCFPWHLNNEINYRIANKINEILV